MHHCPHCQHSLKVGDLLSMNPNASQICPSCGQRYGWDGSAALMLALIPLVTIGVMLLIIMAESLPGYLVLGALPLLMALCTVLAFSAMRPVAR